MAASKNLSIVIRAKDRAAGVFRKMRGRMQRLKKALGPAIKSFGKLGVAVGAAAAAMGYLTKKIIDQGDRWHKLSQTVGVTANTLSSLQLTAEQGGADIEMLGKGMAILNKRAYKAGEGTKSFARAFEGLGVNVLDANGNLQGARQLFMEVSNGLANMDNKSKRAALAQELFGNSMGQNLLPVLNQGGEAIRKQIKRTKELGLVWSEKAADQAAEFNDALTELKTGLRGGATQIVQKMLPTLHKMIPAIKEVASWFVAFAKIVGKSMKSSMSDTADMVEDFGKNKEKLHRKMEDMVRSVAWWINFLRNFGKGIKLAFTAVSAAITSSLAFFAEGIFKFFSDTLAGLSTWFTSIQNLARKAANFARRIGFDSAADTLGSLSDELGGFGDTLESGASKMRDWSESAGDYSDIALGKVKDISWEMKDVNDSTERWAQNARKASENLEKAKGDADKIKIDISGGLGNGDGDGDDKNGGGGGDKIKKANEQYKKRYKSMQNELISMNREKLSQSEKLHREYMARYQKIQEAPYSPEQKERLLAMLGEWYKQKTEKIAEEQKKEYQRRQENIRENRLQELQEERRKQQEKIRIQREGMRATELLMHKHGQVKKAMQVKEGRNLLQNLAKHNKTAFEMNKAFAISDAIINTYKGVTKSLSDYPMPIAAIFAAMHLAQGMLQVKKIKQQQFGGKSAGGGGGAGGGAGAGAGTGRPRGGAPEPRRQRTEDRKRTQVKVDFSGLSDEDIVTDAPAFARSIVTNLNEAYRDDVNMEFVS